MNVAGDPTWRKRVDALLARAAARASAIPVPPADVEGVFAVPFAFNTPSPALLGAVSAGAIMNRVDVLITTPFTDPAAFVTFGLALGGPSVFLAPGDSRVFVAAQYQVDALVTVAAPDTLELTISPGASVAGAGLLFFKLLP